MALPDEYQTARLRLALTNAVDRYIIQAGYAPTLPRADVDAIVDILLTVLDEHGIFPAQRSLQI